MFSAPPRSVWDLPYPQANARCRELTGAGLSVQAFRLLPRMIEVEAYRDQDRQPLYEVHPELVFRSLHKGLLPDGKKTWNGQQRRRALLAGAGVVLPDRLPEAGSGPPDDVLDAAAVAWAADRVARGTGHHLPAEPDQFDHRGRPIVIWY